MDTNLLGILFLLAVAAIYVIVVYIKGNSQLRQLKNMSEFIEIFNIGGKDYVLIKKRSPSLKLYTKKLEIPCFRYEQKTPYYRTVTIGHASTTEYVDDSGLVRAGVIETEVGYMGINNNLYKEAFNGFLLYVTPDLYKEFLETFEDSKNYVTIKTKIDARNLGIDHIMAIDLRKSRSSAENLSQITSGYCKYGRYYIEKFNYGLLQELKSAEEIQKLCNWFNSCS